MRVMFYVWSVVLALLAAPGSAFAQAAPPPAQMVPGKLMFSGPEEALYQERFRKLFAGGPGALGETYDPLEPVPGAANWTPLPLAVPAERTISPGALKAATEYAAANNSDSFIVWRRGKVETEVYFGGHAKTSSIITRSLAKPITAVAVGRAIMLGKIKSLDQPVADFVKEWKRDPRRSKILVRHLLDMRTGFLPQANATDPADILNRAYLHPRHDEIIVKEYPVVDEPGTRYEYNNATSEMVAVLIERATGRRYAEFIGAEIWQKIGALGGQVWINRPGGMAHSGCCMLVPAESMLRLALLLLRDGTWEGQRLLPDGYVTQMTTPTAENPHAGMGVYVAGRYTQRRGAANPDRGAPKTLHSAPYLASDLYLFDGNANQVVYIVPSEDLIVLRTGVNPPKTKDQEWDNAALPNIILQGIVAAKGTSVPQAP
ncbi:MAG: beta-lactamase family protein [Rhodospirillaceae bacterium]|nr:beta-lactamase family protein [Rhodospirillaceae bacterium]